MIEIIYLINGYIFEYNGKIVCSRIFKNISKDEIIEKANEEKKTAEEIGVEKYFNIEKESTIEEMMSTIQVNTEYLICLNEINEKEQGGN